MKTLTNENKKIIFSIILVLIAILMIFVIRPILENPETYIWITDILDEKKTNVTGLLAASTSASTLITLIPGDVGTPIADQLAQLSSLFLLILSFLYMEKYLLTLIGSIFSWCIGIGALLVLISMWLPQQEIGERLRYISRKIRIFAFVIICIIPVSTGVTHLVDTTYEASITQTVQEAVEASDENTTVIEEEDKTIWEEWAEALENVVNSATSVVSDGYEWAQNALNHFIEAAAVMVVTSCVIPLLTLAIIVWLAKTVLENSTGKQIPLHPKQIPYINQYLDADEESGE